MTIADDLRILGQAQLSAEQQRLREMARQRALGLARLRTEANTDIPNLFARCVAAAKTDASKRKTSVLICSKETADDRECYREAARSVMQMLIREGVSSDERLDEFHGHLNSDEVVEHHYYLYVDMEW